MTDRKDAPSTEQLPELLNTLLGNEELMSKLSGIVNSSADDAPSSPGNISTALSDPALLAKLPDVIATLRPMFDNKSNSQGAHKDSHGAGDRRTALLCALKPYLSPKRCEAIDYIMKINRLGEVMKNIKL